MYDEELESAAHRDMRSALRSLLGRELLRREDLEVYRYSPPVWRAMERFWRRQAAMTCRQTAWARQQSGARVVEVAFLARRGRTSGHESSRRWAMNSPHACGGLGSM